MAEAAPCIFCGVMLDVLAQNERFEIIRLWELAEGLRKAGDAAGAEAGLRRLSCFLPAVPDILVRYAALSAARGRHLAAATAYGRAAVLLPEQDELLRRAAEYLWLSGNRDAASRTPERCLRHAPLNAAAWLTRTHFCRDTGDAPGAARALRRALLLDPGNWQFTSQTGIDLANAADLMAAVRWQRRAIRLAPDEQLPRAALSDAVRSGVPEQRDSALLRDLLELVECLTSRPRGLVRALLTLILHEPAFRHAEDLLEAGGDGRLGEICDLIRETGLPRLMGLEILPNQRVEALITVLRHRLLAAWDGGFLPAQTSDVLEAVADHCQLHEYSLAEGQDEAEILMRLRAAVASGGEPLQLVLLACYEPVFGAWNGRPALSGALAPFRERHIDTPLRVRAAAESAARLTDLAPGVSEAVGRQYEEDPYPRWIRPPARSDKVLRARLETLFPSRAETFGPALERPEILIAGCGTGQEACALAASYPEAKITAVDLSRSSLGYARYKAETFGLGNIRFGQADILKLADLGRDFDFIESVGVLHHMEHPEKGLGALVPLLRSGGVMHLGLYSRRGRVAVNAARALIAEWGLEPTPEGIRDARQRLFALRDSRPDLAGLFVSPDFYSRPSCRDLIFHVQEHQYDVPGLRALVEGAGLELLGFELQADRLANYRMLFPADAEVCDWNAVDAFEQRMPWAFSEMYRFWLIKP